MAIMKTPTMLYKANGAHAIHGGFFDTLIVDANLDGAIASAERDGWALTTSKALMLANVSQKAVAKPQVVGTK